jgi:hypothetical protein
MLLSVRKKILDPWGRCHCCQRNFKRRKRGCISPFSTGIIKYLRLSTLGRQEVYLAHTFGGWKFNIRQLYPFSLWGANPWLYHNMSSCKELGSPRVGKASLILFITSFSHETLLRETCINLFLKSQPLSNGAHILKVLSR